MKYVEDECDVVTIKGHEEDIQHCIKLHHVDSNFCINRFKEPINITETKEKETMKGHKDDENKPMFTCLPPDALMELGKVAEIGARKYGLHNYRKGIPVSRLLDAAMRHLIQAMKGEDNDQIDKNSHLASVAWNALSALQMLKDHPELDNRYKGES